MVLCEDRADHEPAGPPASRLPLPIYSLHTLTFYSLHTLTLPPSRHDTYSPSCFCTQIHISLGFTFFSMVLFLISFWDSSGPESLVLVAVQIIAFFAVNPFLIGSSVCAKRVSHWRLRTFIPWPTEIGPRASPTVSKYYEVVAFYFCSTYFLPGFCGYAC